MCLGVSIAVLALYDFILAKYAFPLTEGWWELLARESGSKILYKDVFIGLPPLYINFIATLQVITKNFYDLRVIFIFIHIAEYLLLVFFIKKFFSGKVAIFSALISELLIISYNSAYLPKDYHLFLSFFVILTLIFLIQYQEKASKYKNILFAGISTGIILLTKQNIGALLVFSSLILIASNSKNIIYFLKYLLIYIAFVAGILILYTQFNGAGWINAYVGNDSKGSIFKVVTRFLSEDITKLTIVELISAYCIYYSWKSKGLIERNFSNFSTIISHTFTLNVKKYWIYPVYAYLLYLGIRISQNKDFSIAASLIFTILIINLFILVSSNKSKFFLIKIGPFGIVIALLCYGNSMTAGYNFVGFQIGIALLFAIILQVAEKINLRILFIYSVLCVLIITNNFVKFRVLNGGNAYSWWGYSIDQVSKNNYQFTNSYLDGMGLSHETKEILEQVGGIISTTNESKKYYFYPDIPIFYQIFNLPVQTKYPILWFDVIPSEKRLDVLREFNEISPDYIFWLKPPRQVYSGHYQLKGSTSVISDLDLQIMEKIEKGEYKQIYTRPVGLIDNDLEDVLREIDVKMYCMKCNSNEFRKWLKQGDIIDIENYDGKGLTGGYWKVKFKNSKAYIDFCKTFNPTILNQDSFLFIVLKKS